MMEIPEQTDLEKVTNACDRIVSYVRAHPAMDPDMLVDMVVLTTFVARIKRSIDLIENFRKVYLADKAEQKEQAVS